VGLGTWQRDRLAWKEALIAERQSMLAAPPVTLSRAADATDISPYSPVRLTGRFLHDKERLVGPYTRRGVAGWHVITPLRLAAGDFVLINRGWVPENRKSPAKRFIGQMTGPVTLDGYVKRPSRQGAFVPDNDPAANQWFTVDPAALARHLGLSGVASYWVIAGPAANPGGYPKGGQGIGMPVNNHLQYAGTWYGLALVLGVCAVAYWRRG
jgi:surfeit locus 1 family protein